MSGLEERERAVELYFTTPMTTAQVVEHLGLSDQAVSGALADNARFFAHFRIPGLT